uniref:ribosomal protein L13 n=1 Tax=Timspurckia oligopyrenoides TaxID=708627 RepID=UPI001FCDA858|nr:ribosomal protein L13 [Timspurckia oligopyrenoides]UNJ17503.1 ribosomal protein L13 [Timspurckia oligopyrenoides]
MNTTQFNHAHKEQWYIIDAKDQTLGRLSTRVASILRGKNAIQYAPDTNLKQHVIVLNAQYVYVSGKKSGQKIYRRHSGTPGGMKTETFEELKNRLPNRIIEHAVKGMLPKGPLGRKLFTQMKVYSGSTHPHEAQKPQAIAI